MIWQIGWQDFVAAAAVVWALWYLGRRISGAARRDTFTGCGTCTDCERSSRQTDRSRPGYVPVESLLKSAGNQR